MTCSDDDRGRRMRRSAEDQRWSHIQLLGGWAVERSGGAVCGLHLARGD
jgi:hypothetical protein